MMMDIRVYRMKAGETKSFCKEGEETAVLLLSGDVVFRFDDQEREVTRKDVFTEGPWAVHVCTKAQVTVEAKADTEILVQSTHNDTEFASHLYAPEDAPWGYSCVGKFGNVAKRRVNTIFDHDIAPWSNMVLGEVLNDRGNWSGYFLTDIPSRKRIISSLTVPKDLAQALWEIRYSRVLTEVFLPFREENFILRQWLRDSRCIPAG